MERAKQNRLLVWLLVCVMLLSAVSGLAYAEEITDVAEMPTTCTVTEGCTLPAGHEGECVLPTAEDTTTACTVTEGCTLPAGHEGECVLPETEDDAAACTVTEGCTLPAGHEGDCVLPAVQADDTAEDVEAGTMTLKDFIAKVEAGNGTFDGQGITVKWEPDEKVTAIQRVQEPNAQYQIFANLTDLNISNINFEYVPADIPQHSDGWSGLNKDWTAEQIRNAEFQFLNSGSTTLTNCSFEKVITSPFGKGTSSNGSFTVTDCTYSNVYNAYATKDIFQSTTVISGNTFENCSGAIYFRDNALQSIAIENNQFVNIDQYAASGKANTRGIIQFDAACEPAGNSKIVFAGNTISENVVNDGTNGGELPVIRQICNMGNVTIQGWTPGEAFSVKIDSENLTLPTLSGDENYTFMGWADSTSYKGPTDCTNADKFLKGGETAASGTYYAVWEVRYTVTYTDGVEGETIFEDQVTTDLLSGTKTPAFNGTPEREGYVFTGWEPAVAETVTADATYVAQWSEDVNGNGVADDTETKYTVTYTDGANGAAFEDQTTADLLSGTKTPAFNGTPEREGYVFAGWEPAVAETVTADATYVAQWSEDANGNGVADDTETKYTVTYTDGVEGETVFEDQITTDLLSGTKTPTFQGEPERKGYVFAGWKPAVAETVTADVVYTAQWTVEQKPVDPEEPSKPDEPTATPAPEATVTPAPTTSPTPEESAIDSPKTGDETNLLLPLAMLGMAGGLLVTLFAAKRAKNRR